MTLQTVVVETSTSPWTVVSAVAGGVGALGSAAGAIAAWRAASKSNQAAVRAQAALGAAMRPHLMFGTHWNGDTTHDVSEPETTVHGQVTNWGVWDATELHVRWHLADGRVVEDSRDELARSPGSLGGTVWLTDLGVVSPADDFPAAETRHSRRSPSASTAVDRVDLTVWDGQHLQQWRVTAVRTRGNLHGAWGSTYTAIE